eukprot:3933868-Rhodomonas_salina.3
MEAGGAARWWRSNKEDKDDSEDDRKDDECQGGLEGGTMRRNRQASGELVHFLSPPWPLPVLLNAVKKPVGKLPATLHPQARSGNESSDVVHERSLNSWLNGAVLGIG